MEGLAWVVIHPGKITKATRTQTKMNAIPAFHRE
jgi:hypothetical protein